MSKVIDMEPLTLILDKLASKKPSGDSWMAVCPAHEDREPSLSLREGADGRVLLNCFAGCSVEAVVKALGLEMRDLFPRKSEPRPEPYPHEKSAPVTLAALTRRSGLPEAFLISLGLVERRGAVVVPYRDRDGNLLHNKHRVALSGKSKYRYEKGAKLCPYGLWRLSDAEPFSSIVLCEGESDAWTLWHHGIPALGIPGANNYKTLDPQLIMGLRSVFLIQEPGSAGEKFVEGLAQRLRDGGYRGKIYIVSFSKKAKDPNELFVQEGAKFKERFRELCNRAPKFGAPKIDDMLICMADIQPGEVDWLWKPYIPSGFLTVLGGKPGLGKSYLTCALAAQIASGQTLPGTTERSGPHSVMIFAAEDDPRTVIHSRLTAAGADAEALQRIFVFDLEKHAFAFEPASLVRLEMMIERYEPKLIIFDPFVSFATSTVDIHRQNEVRALLSPLMRIAAKTQVAIILVVHVKKGSVSYAIDSLVGSVDFSAAVRSALLVYPDPRDPHVKLLAHAKHNLTGAGETLKFSLKKSFRWLGTSEKVAEVLASMSTVSTERHPIEEAKRMLEVELAEGRCESKVVQQVARELGISAATLCRARQELGIQSRKESFGGPWILVWPKAERLRFATQAKQSDVPF